jgi:hypothetical protein
LPCSTTSGGIELAHGIRGALDGGALGLGRPGRCGRLRAREVGQAGGGHRRRSATTHHVQELLPVQSHVILVYCEALEPMSSATHFMWGFIAFTLVTIIAGILAFWLVFKLA